MLSLDSPRWSELRHAYGCADDIPNLLRQLDALPADTGDEEPWFSIWSALAHQGDVYSASFAAVPHVVAALARDPAQADASYLHFPAWIEICRSERDVAVPHDLANAYFAALSRLPVLVAEAARRDWSSSDMSSALAAIAVAKGDPVTAHAVLELTPDVAQEFLEWVRDR